MKTISLTRGKVATVDDDDYERLSQSKWQARLSHGNWYAYRCIRVRNAATRKKACYNLSMHEAVMGSKPGLRIDHRDGVTLDNRKENLRHATGAQNAFNMKGHSRTGFKGVSLMHESTRCKNRFRAYITVNYKRKALGLFATPQEAATAYNAAALKYFGDFARLNRV